MTGGDAGEAREVCYLPLNICARSTGSIRFASSPRSARAPMRSSAITGMSEVRERKLRPQREHSKADEALCALQLGQV